MPVKGNAKSNPKQGRLTVPTRETQDKHGKPPVVVERVSDEEFQRVQATVLQDYAEVFKALADA